MEELDRPIRRSGKRSKRTLSDRRRFELKVWGLGPKSEIELLSIHREFLRAAGASDVFLTLLDAEYEDNPVQQEVRRVIFYGDLDGPPEDFTLDSGAFISALWDGDLYEAYRHHADFDRGYFLESVLGEDRIDADRPSPDAPRGSELDSDRYFTCLLPVGPSLDQ